MKRDLLIVDNLLVDQSSEDMDALREVVDDCHNREVAGFDRIDKDTYHLARLPAIVVEQYINDRGITFDEWMNNPEHINRMLNDPALKGFRVHHGKV